MYTLRNDVIVRRGFFGGFEILISGCGAAQSRLAYLGQTNPGNM